MLYSEALSFCLVGKDYFYIHIYIHELYFVKGYSAEKYEKEVNQYTILNVHYRQIHSFCRMILELIGIHERDGHEPFNAYSLDMNLLLELG